MRIGILTFHYPDNYGAVLQAYALQEQLKQFGHDVWIVNTRYAPPRKIGLRIKRDVKRLLNAVRGRRPCRHAAERRRRLFGEFRTNHLRLTRPVALNELDSFAKDYDAFVVGSDQVWNGHFWSVPRLAYFLDFCRQCPSTRRISYAPCFGQPDQPKYLLEHLDEWLGWFDHLSIRGDTGRELIREYTRHDPITVVDPTVLHSFDEVGTSPVEGRPYVLVYPFSQRLSGQMRRLTEKLASDGEVEVVSLAPRTTYAYADRYCDDCGVFDFVRLIRDARFVLTDSFHGTVLSVIFQVPFLALHRGQRAMRIADFLGTLQLGDRLLVHEDVRLEERRMAEPIDYQIAHERLHAGAERSREFLREALS